MDRGFFFIFFSVMEIWEGFILVVISGSREIGSFGGDGEKTLNLG